MKTLEQIRTELTKMGVQNSIYERDGIITLSEMRIDKKERGKGLGTVAMNMLTKYADHTNQTILLSPSTDFGASSVGRLENFYSRFGFIKNKGRNKDYRYSYTMYRKPKSEVVNEMKYKDFYILPEAITDHTWKIGLAKKIYKVIVQDVKSGMNDYKFTYKDHHVAMKKITGDTKTYPPIVGLEYGLEIYHKDLKNCYLIFCPNMLLTRLDGKLTGLWRIGDYNAIVIKTIEGNFLLNIPVVRDQTVEFDGEEIKYPPQETIENNLKRDAIREMSLSMESVIVHEIVHLLDVAVKKNVLYMHTPYKNRPTEVKAYFIGDFSKFIKKKGYSKYKNKQFKVFFNDFINSDEYSNIYKELTESNKRKISKWLYQIYEKKIK